MLKKMAFGVRFRLDSFRRLAGMHFSSISSYSDYSDETSSLWIFGYGSLIWNPGFNFVEMRKGYAQGFARRMYQGNTYHRGDSLLPGRVATLIEDPSEAANGVVFLVIGRENIAKAIEHLKEREVGNGYEFMKVDVDVTLDSETMKPNRIEALTCVAHQHNEFYLGPDDIRKMAYEICTAKGCAGPNCEYVIKLAEHVRRLFPEDEDEHLFELETHIRSASV